MEYCPEIALLHGAFAYISKQSQSGKVDLLHHKKGDKSCHLFLTLKAVIHEIIDGPQAPRSQQEQKKWSHCLHQLLFCKSFLYNSCFVSREVNEEITNKTLSPYSALCLPIPDFHPHLFFDLSDEFEWTEFLGESLRTSADWQTAIDFASQVVQFCAPEPALFYDLNLMSVTLDFLVSSCLSEILQPADRQDVREGKGGLSDTTPLFPGSVVISRQKYEEMFNTCLQAAVQMKHTKTDDEEMSDISKMAAGQISQLDEKTDREVVQAADRLMQEKVMEQLDQKVQDAAIKLTDHVGGMLMLVQKRMSSKLFDRSSCKSEAISKVLRILGHLLSSVVVFSIVSFSTGPCHGLKQFITQQMFVDEDNEVGHNVDDQDTITSQDNGENSPSLSDPEDSVSFIAEALGGLAKTSATRMSCLKCLSSFFTMPTGKGSPTRKLSIEKAAKFGHVLKLNLRLSKLPRALKSVQVFQKFSELLNDEQHRDKEDSGGELKQCMSTILEEFRWREKIAEEKRLHPSLAEVMSQVERKQPRWKWCLQYGLAQTDLKGWWFAGFLEFLHKNSSVLDKESDVRRLLYVLVQMFFSTKPAASSHQQLCTELILETFSQLPLPSQEKIILDVYKDRKLSALPLVPDFDQSLMITFNKLSASASSKNVGSVLRLALHNLLTFTEHAVSTAINSEGQIPFVVKLLEMLPEAMRSVHPLHHRDCSLLGHCLHLAILGRSLNDAEQKNMLTLVSALVQTHKKDGSQLPPVLSPSEILSTSVLPFITHSSDPPISIDFALKLLIGCLEATLCAEYSDWLKEVHAVVVVACCGETLQDCVELVREDEEVGRLVTHRSLVLAVLDLLKKHFIQAEMSLEAHSAGWLQKRCMNYDWTVCGYLAWFLSSCNDTEETLLIAQYAKQAIEEAPWNPSSLLQLSAVSDTAAVTVVQTVEKWRTLVIPHTPVIISLCQVLPNVLVTEVRRVVQVLSALVQAGCVVDVTPRHPLSLGVSTTGISGCEVEQTVSQLLTDTAIVIVSIQTCASASVLQHVGQVLVAALQTVLLNSSSQERSKESSLLDLHVFLLVCDIASTCPDVMLDSLSVILLDIVARLATLESPEDETHVNFDSVQQEIRLIPRQSLQEALLKKLERQPPSEIEKDQNSD